MTKRVLIRRAWLCVSQTTDVYVRVSVPYGGTAKFFSRRKSCHQTASDAKKSNIGTSVAANRTEQNKKPFLAARQNKLNALEPDGRMVSLITMSSRYGVSSPNLVFVDLVTSVDDLDRWYSASK